ncbi:integrase core domain-containing protein, partial [Micromonospora carbonacea]|uniref:integrase core domain-containing protein n=1 Tax=Micromonospora carbonacea TaxID=47853 RepID=UPI0033F71883
MRRVRASPHSAVCTGSTGSSPVTWWAALVTIVSAGIGGCAASRRTRVDTAQAAIDVFRDEYNTDRPHQSLDMAFPADR